MKGRLQINIRRVHENGDVLLRAVICDEEGRELAEFAEEMLREGGLLDLAPVWLILRPIPAQMEIRVHLAFDPDQLEQL